MSFLPGALVLQFFYIIHLCLRYQVLLAYSIVPGDSCQEIYSIRVFHVGALSVHKHWSWYRQTVLADVYWA